MAYYDCFDDYYDDDDDYCEWCRSVIWICQYCYGDQCDCSDCECAEE